MTDNWNNAADKLASDAKKAAEDAKIAAEDSWNQVKDTTTNAADGVSETVSTFPDSTQNVVDEAKAQAQDTWNTVSDNVAEKADVVKEGVSDTWNQAAEAVQANTGEVKQDLGKTAEAAKATVGEGWSMASEPVVDAASEMKTAAVDSWNVVSDKVETGADALKENAQGTWESAKDSTQQEWQNVTDEVSKPDPNNPSTWKQDVYTAADTVKKDAGEVIPSWDSYKQTNPESIAPVMPEYTAPKETMQPVVIPPTTTAFGNQAQMPPIETAKSYTSQTPAYQPLPVTAKTKKGLPAWAIVLLVIGALILLCVLVGVIFFGGIVRSILQGSIPLQMVLSQFLV